MLLTLWENLSLESFSKDNIFEVIKGLLIEFRKKKKKKSLYRN